MLKRIREETANGATREEIAGLCGVSVRTIAAHANQFPQLSQALEHGDKAASQLVVAALFKRATGYSAPAVKIMQSGGKVIRVEYTQHYPPDTQAIIFFLCNRDPKHWKQRIEPAPEDSKPWPAKISFSADVIAPRPRQARQLPVGLATPFSAD